MFLTILYIIGITAEGMSGALIAGRHKMDLMGVLFIALAIAGFLVQFFTRFAFRFSSRFATLGWCRLLHVFGLGDAW